MALVEYDLFKGKIDKVQTAINRLKTFEPADGYFLAFSGGKDSVTIERLAKMANVKYDAHYNVTTIDPPELIGFMKEFYHNVVFDRPIMPFFRMLTEIEMFPPTRAQRWCCRHYKERGGTGRIIVTGIRWAESSRRKKRKMVEHCLTDKSKNYVHPIIDWTDDEVWEFIRKYNVPFCQLYQEGLRRIGCLLCPMSDRKNHAQRWPKFASVYKKMFQKLWHNRQISNKPILGNWKTWEELWDWWINDLPRENPDQTVMFE